MTRPPAIAHPAPPAAAEAPPPGDADCVLRPLTAGLVPALAAPCGMLFQETEWDPPSLERVLAAPGHFAFLAHTARHGAGLVLARSVADECEILWILVAAGWRRQGLGRRLLRAALGQAALAKARTAYLEVAETNAAAIALYTSEGFQLTGRRTAYYRPACGAEPLDALLYKKALAAGQGQNSTTSIV